MPPHHLRHFYDATTPSNVPAGSLAAVYVNASGSFAWNTEEVRRMRAVFGISESGDPAWMEFGRCVAVEPGAAEPSQAPNCLRARREHGHKDGMCYVNRGNWEEVEDICLQAGEHPVWWVAAPGLSVSEAQGLRSPVKGHQPVAVQTEWHASYDLSVVIHDLEFTPSHKFRATG